MLDLGDIFWLQQLTVFHETAVDEVVAFNSSKSKGKLRVVNSGNVIRIHKEFGSGGLPTGLEVRLATIIGNNTGTHPSVGTIKFLLLIVPSKSLVVSSHHIALFSDRNTLFVVFEKIWKQEICDSKRTTSESSGCATGFRKGYGQGMIISYRRLFDKTIIIPLFSA